MTYDGGPELQCFHNETNWFLDREMTITRHARCNTDDVRCSPSRDVERLRNLISKNGQERKGDWLRDIDFFVSEKLTNTQVQEAQNSLNAFNFWSDSNHNFLGLGDQRIQTRKKINFYKKIVPHCCLVTTLCFWFVAISEYDTKMFIR